MAGRQNGEASHHQESELLSELEAELGGAHHEGGIHHEDELESLLHEDEFFAPEAPHHEQGFHEQGFHEQGLHEGEQFFGGLRKLARGVGRFVSKAAPILRSVAKIAVPMVAGAVGGPFGAILGRVATQALGEEELMGEDELAGLHEDELEAVLHEDEVGMHHEDEAGMHHEDELAALHEEEVGMHHETSPEVLPELGAHHEVGAAHELGGGAHEVLAEMMAESAALAQHEAEAEAMAGGSVVAVLSAADRAALRRLLPQLIRGVAVLTRILRRRRITRPALRTVPTIFRQTVRALRRRLAAGQPVTRRLAGQVLASNTRRILSSPRACGVVIFRNLRTNLRANSGRRVNG
jgi:hypothetical protein